MSQDSVPRGSPFARGEVYEVLEDFDCLRDSFKKGERLRYQDAAWSRYDGYTGYFFTQDASGALRTIDVEDGEPLERFTRCLRLVE